MNKEELIKEMDRVCNEYVNHIITSKQIEYHILDKIKALETKAATIGL